MSDYYEPKRDEEDRLREEHEQEMVEESQAEWGAIEADIEQIRESLGELRHPDLTAACERVFAYLYKRCEQ